ncbi:MAG: tyrosine-type recombinase/integrase [Pyrinomonadaceae bacterium]
MRRELENSGQSSLESDKVTFAEVADRYKELKLNPPVFRNGIKVSGLRSYKTQRYILKPLKEFFGRKKIRSIKPSDLEDYKGKRLATPVIVNRKVKRKNPNKGRKKYIFETVEESRDRSIASVNRELSLLRQIFGFALSEDLILRNPFERTKKLISLAAEKQRDRVLSKQEEISLLAACESSNRIHIRPIIITALDTAMRKGEQLKLKWEDVNFNESIITVLATNTKTEKERLIGMTSRVKAELKELWNMSPKNREILVFGIENNFKRAWKSALKEAGLDNSDLRFHDLRHTAITRMVRAGVSIAEAMKVSGHTEMKTFQRYVNLTNESVSHVAELLEEFNRQTLNNEFGVSESSLVN